MTEKYLLLPISPQQSTPVQTALQRLSEKHPDFEIQPVNTISPPEIEYTRTSQPLVLINTPLSVIRKHILQQLLFSNSTSIDLKGNLELNGLKYAMPFPGMVCHGVKDVLLNFSTNDMIPVLPGNICTIFFAINGIDICCMYSCLEA